MQFELQWFTYMWICINTYRYVSVFSVPYDFFFMNFFLNLAPLHPLPSLTYRYCPLPLRTYRAGLEPESCWGSVPSAWQLPEHSQLPGRVGFWSLSCWSSGTDGQPARLCPQNVLCAFWPALSWGLSSVPAAATHTSAILPLPQASRNSGYNSRLRSLQRHQRHF